jgi:hypothetical protein
MKAATLLARRRRAMTLVVDFAPESLAAGEDVKTAGRTVLIRGILSFY